MRKDKDVAISLRREGKTYRQIEKELTISRSTLCDWFKDLEWSRHIKVSNSAKNQTLSTERLKLLHIGMRKKLDKYYEQAKNEAEEEYLSFCKEPLFHAGLMLYLGEGDKINKSTMRLANTDFYVHKIFIKFLIKYLDVKMSDLRVWILAYPDLDIEECANKWSFELDLPRSQFNKTQVIQGRESSKRLQFGVGNITISSAFKKTKLFRWIELSKETLSAGMVQG